MRTFTSIFVLIIFNSFLFGQNTIDHFTGNFRVTIFDNGAIGSDGTGIGVIEYEAFYNVVYSGGIVFAHDSSVKGNNDITNLDDFVTLLSWSGFNSNSIFDQILNYKLSVLSDSSLIFFINTLSKNDLPVIFIRIVIQNRSAEEITDVFPGIILDLDINNYPNYNQNSGGYDPERNLMYMFDATLNPADTSYYGISLLNKHANSMHGKMGQWYYLTNTDVYHFLTNSDFSIQPLIEDQAFFISDGPHDIPAGETITCDFAILAGDNLEDLQNNVGLASEYASSIITDIKDEETLSPDYNLIQNYPNPFNPTTTISYSIMKDDFVNIQVFDMVGQKVSTLVNEYQHRGSHEIIFDASNLASGIYFYQIRSGNFSAVRKMILLK